MLRICYIMNHSLATHICYYILSDKLIADTSEQDYAVFCTLLDTLYIDNKD